MFDQKPWPWIASRHGSMLDLPGQTILPNVAVLIQNDWTAYEATVTGVHLLGPNHTLFETRSIGEMAALGADLTCRRPKSEWQP